MAHTAEPHISQSSRDPHGTFRNAIVEETEEILKQAKLGRALVECFVLTEFGLDVAVFVHWPDRLSLRLLELKPYVGSRQGGVGFGNGKGEGCQVDLLLLSNPRLHLADQYIRWILVDGTKPAGAKRFAILDNSRAKSEAMGGVSRGKQNNLRINPLMTDALSWDDLSGQLQSFLMT